MSLEEAFVNGWAPITEEVARLVRTFFKAYYPSELSPEAFFVAETDEPVTGLIRTYFGGRFHEPPTSESVRRAARRDIEDETSVSGLGNRTARVPEGQTVERTQPDVEQVSPSTVTAVPGYESEWGVFDSYDDEDEDYYDYSSPDLYNDLYIEPTRTVNPPVTEPLSEHDAMIAISMMGNDLRELQEKIEAVENTLHECETAQEIDQSFLRRLAERARMLTSSIESQDWASDVNATEVMIGDVDDLRVTYTRHRVRGRDALMVDLHTQISALVAAQTELRTARSAQERTLDAMRFERTLAVQRQRERETRSTRNARYGYPPA